MLVATIAATATFKWLTSENRSSASRMQVEEARQSAIAGIQSTRAWMTNNANEVGAVVRQYIVGGKQPILLNNRVTAHMSSKQNFNVWVTGISENNGFYKFKILSEGISSNNAKHTEAAIINVSGLYQVDPPIVVEKVKNIVYDYTYFGGSVRNHGEVKTSSMLINGNWHGNPVDIDKNLIITGNARLSGNNVNIYGTGCFGGTLNADNGLDAKNIYTAGTAKKFGTKGTIGVSNHAYFDGIVEQDENRKIRIGGNMTANNLVQTHMGNGTSSFTVEGNMCLGKNAQIQIGEIQKKTCGNNCDYNYPVTFKVDGDVWINHPYSFYAREKNNGDFHGKYDKIILGSKPNSKVYIKDAYPYSSYTALRTSKTFLENENFRQQCSHNVPGNSRGCYNRTDDAARKTYQWDYWHNERKTPYINISSNPNMYYFYYVEPGVTDVEFKEYNNPDWQNSSTGSSWNSPTAIGAYHVGGNVFYKKTFNNQGQAQDVWNEYNFGDGIEKKRSPYCLKVNSDKFRPECHVTPWFKSNGTITRDMPSTKPVTCADSVKNVCDEIWEKKPGCDGAKYKVDDILKTAYDKFEPFAEKGCAKNIKVMSSNFVSSMNSCYSENMADATKKENNLYNGYLVVKIKAPELINHNADLKGKFIIILEEKPPYGRETNIPATSGKNDFVFLYLTEGANQIKSVDNAVKTYNYFIYTPKDVGTQTQQYTSEGIQIEPSINGFLFNKSKFKGSIYAVAATCAKISSITTQEPMEFNQALVDDLNQSRIICAATVTNCGGPAYSSSSGAAPTSSVSAESLIGGRDPYYISIAPQLNVTLESQYKATESTPSNNVSEVQPSILVLPRIIYLTKNAPGTLADYYSILNLNGANEVKSPSKVTCNGGIATTGKLTTVGSYLEEGTFKCDYTTSRYGAVPFYVVVSNTTEDLPEVSFTTSSQALNLGESVNISVHIDKSAATTGEKLKFDFSVSDVSLYGGWSVELAPSGGATITERSGSGSNKRYYTVEVTPNATEEQNINLLKVTTEEGAADGDIYVTLSSPTVKCKIGGRHTHHVYVMGHTSINRGSLADYCARYTCDETFREKQLSPDCNYTGEWVTISGTGCSEHLPNNSWSCLTNTPLSLESVNEENIPSNCEVILPTENNTIDEPQSGNNYTLYASLVQKKIELTVKLNDAKDDYTYIRVYDQYFMEEHRCKKSESPCTFKVIAGSHVVISHEDYGTDREGFNNWICSGDNCPSPTINYNEYEFTPYGDHTIIAEYNKESHCYYDDFANTTAFCPTDGVDCIDTCRTSLQENKGCNPRNTTQEKPHWLMTYHNKGKGNNSGYERPIFGSGSIFASNSQNANNQSGKSSIILRNMNAGQYGTMNALVQTTILNNSDPNEYLNTGLIFRSNGSEHLVLNIYGASNEGNNSGKLTFRVCKVIGQGINSSSKGSCKLVNKKPAASDISITSNSFIKVAFTIDNKDLLTVKASTDDKTWEGEISVKDFGCNDITHTYVGFSLADPAFKLYDNGWASSSFDETCWEIPSVSCSFADNYNGEKVPLAEDVTPKVLMSSWFTEKNCTTEYHYNGCDNETSSKINCTGPHGNGEPGEMGAVLTGDAYRFSQEGAHGYLIEEGKLAQDASVKVVCPGDQTSLDLSQDHYSCGAFWVGDVYTCSNEISIYSGPLYLSENTTQEFTFDATNMRGASLHIHIETDENGPNKPLNANIEVQLESSNGMKSLTRTINSTGPQEISVDVLANTIGFDPQQVTKMFIKSNQNIYLNDIKIESKCKDKLELKCSDITAEYKNDGWHIKVPPQKKSVKCTYTPSDDNIETKENIIGCTETVLRYKAGGGFGFGWMTGPMNTITFDVTATDKNGATVQCSNISGGNITGMYPTCRIPEDKQSIPLGNPPPPFIFKGSDNPMSMLFDLVYKVRLDGEQISSGNVKSNVEKTVNIDNSISLSSGTHTYEVELCFNGTNCQSCSKDFVVQDPEQKLPKINSCSVNKNGEFSVVITNDDDVEYSYAIAVTDVNGVSITGTNGTSSETSLSYTYTPRLAGQYGYGITISGDEEHKSCLASLTVTSNLSVSCPGNIKNQNPNNAINITASASNCGESCFYKIFDANSDNERASSSDPSLSFYDVNGTGTKSYKLQATDSYGNTSSCTFNVSFASAQSSAAVASSNSNTGNTSIAFKFTQTWTTLAQGNYNVRCIKPDQYTSTRLYCRCIDNQGYNCNVEYNGKKTSIAANNGNGQSVDGESDKCENVESATLKVLAPSTSGLSWQHSQKPGIECRYSY